MKIVATTSLPAVDRPNAERWNAARSRQNNFKLNISAIFENLPLKYSPYYNQQSLPPELQEELQCPVCSDNNL